MSRFLIAYSTTDGHTRLICERLRETIERHGHAVTVKRLDQCGSADLQACDAVVIGASIRYGKHQPQVAAFIARHQAALEARRNAFFTVNVVARKPGKDVPEGNPYLQKFLRGIAWRPQRLAVFAGRIDYPRLRWADRTIIRLIMWITRGPTDPTGSYEFTDWARVDAFGDELAGDPVRSFPLEATMDLKLHMLDSFAARGSDGKSYKVCVYERMHRDDTVHDGQEHWLPTGVSEYRLDSGEQIDARADGSLTVLHSGVALRKG